MRPPSEGERSMHLKACSATQTPKEGKQLKEIKT
jgi:hypothetical protein